MKRWWTPTLEKRLKELHATDKYFFSEIAQILKIQVATLRHHARILGLKQPAMHRFGQWNAKHKHLRHKAMQYFQTHSAEETAAKFNLTASEFKSLCSVAYRDVLIPRKDTRTHAPWDLNEWLFVLRHCGIKERGWIAKQMGRSVGGKHHAIKERLRKVGGGTSKFLNGMPYSWATALWGDTYLPKSKIIKTDAGPSGARGSFRFRLIPWIDAEEMSKVFVTPRDVQGCIRAMAKFQRFIHMVNDRTLRGRLKREAKKR